MPSYPAEPWSLRGQLHSAAFLVPLADVPLPAPVDDSTAPGALPAGCRPLRVGGRGVVGVAWVQYEPGGVLTYRELMATLLVRRGRRVHPSILAIWVDSPASRDGGRALWGIPKELAEFAFTAADGPRASFAADGIARGSARRLAALPGRWPLRFAVAQTLAGAARISPVRARGALALTRPTVDPDPSGPLGFLAGHRPLLGVTLRDFAMCFGRAADAGADCATDSGATRPRGVEWAR